MAPRIGECLPEILELKVALVLVEFEPMVVVVPFLVESELFHGGVVEDRWLSVASRAHRLNQGLATADCAAAAVARARARPSCGFFFSVATAAAADEGPSAPRRRPAHPAAAWRRPVAGLLHPRGGRRGSQWLPAFPALQRIR